MPTERDNLESCFQKCIQLAEQADSTMQRILWLSMADNWRKLMNSCNPPEANASNRVDILV